MDLAAKTVECGEGESAGARCLSTPLPWTLARYMEEGRPQLVHDANEQALFPSTTAASGLATPGAVLIIKHYVQEIHHRLGDAPHAAPQLCHPSAQLGRGSA
ncbi:MAG: hypothetical protein R2854_02180 [Caldilineaceae bacterium]